MIAITDDIYIERRTSCTRDEAAAKLMGWLSGSVRNNTLHVAENGTISLDQLPTAHSLDGPLLDYLVGLRGVAQRDMFEVAGIDGGVFIHEKAEAVARLDEMIDKAVDLLSKIDCEIAKGASSTLIIDRQTTAELGVDHIMLDSLDQWARERLNICILPTYSVIEKAPVPEQRQSAEIKPREDSLHDDLDHGSRDGHHTSTSLTGKILETRAQPSAVEKPWEEVDPRDPQAVQPWYTPARYFARQLVRETPMLLTDRDALVKKIAQALTVLGINKRGGKKPFSPDTIKKALSKVCLG